MHYYIDGYNLLFRVMRASDEDLQTQREMIIQDLNAKIQLVGLDATIVFDSQYQIGESTRSHFNYLEILFTSQGETADDCILSELKSSLSPRQETVVTSDKGLAWRARRKHVHTESVEEFLSWLNLRYKNKKRQQKKQTLFANGVVEGKSVVKVSIPPKKENVPPAEPSVKASPEECFDFYLGQFEQHFQELIKDMPQVVVKPSSEELQPKPPKFKSKKPKKGDGEPGISDFERWLKVFEDDLDSNDNRH